MGAIAHQILAEVAVSTTPHPHQPAHTPTKFNTRSPEKGANDRAVWLEAF
ncbi:MAG: hypothetical protein AAGM36_15690 [Cyanobacteria bacterium J06597_1]